MLRTTSTDTLAHPERIDLWREAFAGLDWLALRLSPAYRGVGLPRGDGSAVILVPGMLCTDATMIEFSGWLRRIGYRPYYSGIARNSRCPDQLMGRLLLTVERAAHETGAPVRIIGHSLGGLLARGAAMRRPGAVAQVFTLGSPVQGLRAHPAVESVGQYLHRDAACDGRCLAALQAPLPPHIAEAGIFSRTDGVVDWRTCTRASGADCVEVHGTHSGLIVNAEVYGAIAHLIARNRAAAPARRTLPPAAEGPQLRLLYRPRRAA
ncbi:MAG: hypothetical protein HYX50_04905 [Chloroflexi bacterium]|nr:hypothetical protein [Chloroflexota bacterium]